MAHHDFYKYQALGNDYLVIDPNKIKLNLDADKIKTICHRHYGIGSDGILYGPVLDGGRFSLRIFVPGWQRSGEERQRDQDLRPLSLGCGLC